MRQSTIYNSSFFLMFLVTLLNWPPSYSSEDAPRGPCICHPLISSQLSHCFSPFILFLQRVVSVKAQTIHLLSKKKSKSKRKKRASFVEIWNLFLKTPNIIFHLLILWLLPLKIIYTYAYICIVLYVDDTHIKATCRYLCWSYKSSGFSAELSVS